MSLLAVIQLAGEYDDRKMPKAANCELRVKQSKAEEKSMTPASLLLQLPL